MPIIAVATAAPPTMTAVRPLPLSAGAKRSRTLFGTKVARSREATYYPRGSSDRHVHDVGIGRDDFVADSRRCLQCQVRLFERHRRRSMRYQDCRTQRPW